MTDSKIRTEFEPGHGYTQQDWDEVAEAGNWKPTDEELAAARSFAEVFPEMVAGIEAPQRAKRLPSDFPEEAGTAPKYAPDHEYPCHMWEPDEENPEITDEQAAQLRPFSEVFPDLSALIDAGKNVPKG